MRSVAILEGNPLFEIDNEGYKFMQQDMILEPLTLLNVNDTTLRAAFEHSFYVAFSRTNNKLTRKIWDWDDEEQRVRTQIPYTSQRVYGRLNEEGIVEMGMAINLDQQHMQIHGFGFAASMTFESSLTTA